MNIKKRRIIRECGCSGETIEYWENDVRKLKLILRILRPQCRKSHFLPLHKEKDININFLNSSSEILQIENKEIIVPKGMYNIINAEQIFGGKDKKKIEISKEDIELVIHPSIFENVLEELNLKKPNCGIEFDINPQRKDYLLENIIKILISSSRNFEKLNTTLLVDTTLFQLAIAFLEKHPNSVQQILKKEPEILKRDARIQKALDYLRDNYNKDISLEELLNVSCVGRAHFFRLFKKETGKTPFEYLSYYRLEKAKELLKKTNKTLEEISEIVGYKDVRCLQEIFYRFTGVSPKHFRSNK